VLLAGVFVLEDETLLLVDGYQRVVSAPQVGRTTVRAEVRVGTNAEALIQAEGLDGKSAKDVATSVALSLEGASPAPAQPPSLANPILIAVLTGPPGRLYHGCDKGLCCGEHRLCGVQWKELLWVTASQSFLTSVTH
jgi:hypothetical protein